MLCKGATKVSPPKKRLYRSVNTELIMFLQSFFWALNAHLLLIGIHFYHGTYGRDSLKYTSEASKATKAAFC